MFGKEVCPSDFGHNHKAEKTVNLVLTTLGSHGLRAAPVVVPDISVHQQHRTIEEDAAAGLRVAEAGRLSPIRSLSEAF